MLKKWTKLNTYLFLHWVLKFVQLKTACERDRFIEELGDDILCSFLDFKNVHPIVLWGTCKVQ